MVNQLTSLVRRQAAKYGNREVFSHKDYSTNRWVSTSWNRFAEQVSDMAKAMVILGIREEENISTYTQNKPEGLIVDFAAFDNRAVTVPLYPTSSLESILSMRQRYDSCSLAAKCSTTMRLSPCGSARR